MGPHTPGRRAPPYFPATPTQDPALTSQPPAVSTSSPLVRSSAASSRAATAGVRGVVGVCVSGVRRRHRRRQQILVRIVGVADYPSSGVDVLGQPVELIVREEGSLPVCVGQSYAVPRVVDQDVPYPGGAESVGDFHQIALGVAEGPFVVGGILD